ncbi:MAG: hypothetical protein CVU55_02880 [Deltaproteobacteria bacterium HGW-Deltaproteobacteria-13]|jgi:PAS domain S-box-containing protein/putative nucleotidyltransferase with HDIG domain|nr:MAG: hypothetical protein CVU55_02880 [Deltaproteobacteria bacterium HGW-Deltaproteobacteria-13]
MEKIIVVDDEEQNLAYLETLFKAHGFQVTTARNGIKALEAAREDPPDIIITDALMPVMDGFMLCREWKADSRLKNIPLIFYTATYTDPKDEKLALDLGCDLFLVKPQEPDVLLDQAQKVMAKYKAERMKIPFGKDGAGEQILQQHNETLFRKLEKKIKQLEEANQIVKESEAKYRSIFENSLTGIYRTTIEGRLLTLNPAFYHMMGYGSPEEVRSQITDIGKQMYLDYHDRENFLQMLNKNNHTEEFITRFRKKDGSIIWVTINAWTVRDENNEVLYYEGMIEDITDRVLREEKLKNAMMGTISIVATIVEERDPYTAGHQRRVAELASAIALELNLPSQQVEGVRIAGLIHDVGKISVPAELLTKPSKLSDIEMSLVQAHAQAGYNILKGIEFPWPILNAIHQHHERINGSGYPLGLSKDNIILEARILAVADVVEAMASHRPYRAALGIDIALKEIEKNKGILYDEDIANVCLNLFRHKGYKIDEGVWK